MAEPVIAGPNAKVHIWIDLPVEGDEPPVMGHVVTIPKERLLELCRTPVKWVFFLAKEICGALNGRLCTGEIRDGTLQLTPIPDADLNGPVGENYYFVPTKNGSRRYVDAAALSDPTSDGSHSSRDLSLRARTILRDHGHCIVCGREEALFCQAAHIIPHSKGEEYLRYVNNSRFRKKVDTDSKLTGLDVVQNAVLVGSGLHQAMDSHSHAFLAISPSSFLQESDIPAPIFETAAPPATVELKDRHLEDAGKLLKNSIVKSILAKEEAAFEAQKGQPPTHFLIYQCLDSLIDVHTHNTRTRVPVNPESRIPQYIADFAYVSSVLSKFGNQDVLGHEQPLSADIFRRIYYRNSRPEDPERPVGRGPRQKYMIEGGEVAMTDADEDSDEEDGNEEDDNEENDEDKESEHNNERRWGKSSGRRGREARGGHGGGNGSGGRGGPTPDDPAPVHSAEDTLDAMDCILYWRTKPRPSAPQLKPVIPAKDQDYFERWRQGVTGGQLPDPQHSAT
ncbi:hypothetical protein B0H15DRAFT_1017512 [Mycena belliarum]|uniref:HNH nuclease domain-containing protein n=1 Tax=Mycena belliarum TaxID=1033014 RepID=A0AAD6Y160_9AGAR|nr:hypothetical protein B0H15DRAFT_1017512 [Mycena belliae]